MKKESKGWRIIPAKGMKNSGQSDRKAEQDLTSGIISGQIDR